MKRYISKQMIDLKKYGMITAAMMICLSYPLKHRILINITAGIQ
jgi:hypothetical protein